MQDLKLNKILLNELEEAFSQSKVTPTPDIDRKKEILSESFSMLAPIQATDFSMLELNNGSFSTVTSLYEHRLEYPAIAPNKKISESPWVTLTHPNDLAFILSLAIDSVRFLNWLPTDRVKDFSLSYQHRLRTKDGIYQCFLISYKTLLSDEQGKPYLLLQNVEPCSFTETKDDKRYRIGLIEPADLISKSKLFKNKELILFTRQEREIIHKVNDDKTCKQISDELNISTKTTKTHFQNITRKANFRSVKQAALHLSKLGLLQLVSFFTVGFDNCFGLSSLAYLL